MKIIDVWLPSSHELIPGGDEHSGSILSYTEGIETMYDYILADPNRYHVKLGDRIEAIAVDDKRFSPGNTKGDRIPIPLQQMESAVEQDSRIATRLIAALIGNHELKHQKFGNLTETYCKNMSILAKRQVFYGTYTCIINVHDHYGLMYRLWLAHGFGCLQSNAKDYEQRQANMKAQLKNKLRYKAGDCLVMGMGHTHKLLVVPPTEQLYLSCGDKKLKQHYLRWDGNNDSFINADVRWYFNSGSFLKMYEDGMVSYSEMAGYDPVELGYIRIKVEDRKIVGIDRVVV